MPRSIWNGAISFGLVNVPVALYSAIEQKDVAFNQFDQKSGKRIHLKRTVEGSGKEIEYRDVVKGYEVSKGKYVIVTPEELESVEPGRSKTIEIEDFVDLAEVDPIYFEKTYYVAPRSGEGADKAYALLREALERSERIGIGVFVMRTKQYLGAIRATNNMLVLETMYFPDEIRSYKELNIPTRVKVGDRELRIAEQLIDNLTTEWDPKKYRDTYRERVQDLIRRKRKGEEIDLEREEEEPSNVVDLFEALKGSLDSIKGGRAKKRPAAAKSTATTRKPARKATKVTKATKKPATRTTKKATARTRARKAS